MISLIAAMDKNRLIGRENGLPWHLPEDFKHFKAVTMGKSVIMGRKTFESIGKPLPGRKNLVISRNGFTAAGILVFPDIDQAIAAAGDGEVMVIGGASLYQQLIDRADRMYLTHVDAECDGDAWFPQINPENWIVVSSQNFAADDRNNYDFTIKEYHRKK